MDKKFSFYNITAYLLIFLTLTEPTTDYISISYIGRVVIIYRYSVNLHRIADRINRSCGQNL